MTSSAGQWRIETRAGRAELSCRRHETLEEPSGAARKDPSLLAGMRRQDPPHCRRTEGRSQSPSLMLGVGSSSRGCSVPVGGPGREGICHLGGRSLCAPQAGMALGMWQCWVPISGFPGLTAAGNEGMRAGRYWCGGAHGAPWVYTHPESSVLGADWGSLQRCGSSASILCSSRGPESPCQCGVNREGAAGTAGPTGLLPAPAKMLP